MKEETPAPGIRQAQVQVQPGFVGRGWTWLGERENNLTGARALAGACDRGVEVAQRITPLDLRPEQTTAREVENFLEGLRAGGPAGVLVPLIHPKAGEMQVLENQQSVRQGERAQTHRPDRHDHRLRGNDFGHPQSALTADLVDPKPNRRAPRRLNCSSPEVVVINQDGVGPGVAQFVD